MTSPDEPRDATPRSIRRVRIGTNVGVQIVLAVALFLVANYLSFRHHQRWDLTRTSDYTLSSTTQNFLDQLEQNAKIIVAVARGSDLFDDVRILVEEYGLRAQGRIDVEFIDPALAPERAEELKNRYRFDLTGNSVIVEMADRQRFIDEGDLATYSNNPGEEPRLIAFHGEDVLTSALISVAEEKQVTLHLVVGKGGDQGGEDGGISGVLARFAKKQNVSLLPLNLADIQEVPTASDGLLLVGPRFDLTSREVALLDRYWSAKRGSLLVLRDPASQTPKLDTFLKSKGVTARDDRVLFAESTAAGPRRIFSVNGVFLPGSPVTTALAGVSTTFPGQSHSLALATENDRLKQESIELKPLFLASERFWGETRFLQELPSVDTRDHTGELVIAASVEQGAARDARIRIESSRMVVVGNASLLDPRTLQEPNYDFVAGSINWLLDRESLIGISPKEKARHVLTIAPEERTRVYWIVGAVLPAAIVLFGMFVWSTRRA